MYIVSFQVEFQIFLLSPPGNPTYAQFYSADVDICVNDTCPNYVRIKHIYWFFFYAFD